ncbi:unnamed protein product, partial [Ectocarpus sp. 12 AP-2014]
KYRYCGSSQVHRAMNQSDFGRSISRCTLAVAVLFGFAAMQALGQEQIYSKGWVTDMLNSGESGSCSPTSRVYEWRNVGWGSNINRFLAVWLDSIVRDSESDDFGVDVSPPCFRTTTCPRASERTVSSPRY